MEKKLETLLNEVKGSLSGEQLEKAMACKTVEELTALLGSVGVELPDELMDAVAGGYQVTDDAQTRLYRISK